jgi:Ras-related protein Rab-8A
MGIIMVYAVNDRTSFNAMENWLKQIKTHAAENVIKILVANKIDCEERKVSVDEGKKLAT